MTNFIQVNRNQCVRCGQCLLNCPNQLFSRQNHDESPTIASHAEEVCIRCGHCVAGCPACAITVGAVGHEMCQTIPKESVPRFEHISTLVRTRRSIRNFKDHPLEVAKLELLLDVVRWAPTARNLQPVKWIVVQNREKMLEVGKLVADAMRKYEQFKRPAEAWDSGNDVILRGAPAMAIAYTESDAIFPAVDCTIAVETLDLCAAAMQIGTCWAGYFVLAAQMEPTIQNWLGLEKGEKVQAALLLGYPGLETYKRIPHRKELTVKWIF
ncbi:MAG: nitroreductase family protein [Planctomycetaceae bacterium]|nr:nitroreductase family protein [Planctomycetaceae bacterium]